MKRLATILVLAGEIPFLVTGCAQQRSLALPPSAETLSRANRDLAGRELVVTLRDGSSTRRVVSSLRPGGETGTVLYEASEVADPPRAVPLGDVRSFRFRSWRAGATTGAEIAFVAGLATGIGLGLSGGLDQGRCVFENCDPGNDKNVVVRFGKGAALGAALGVVAALAGAPIGAIIGRPIVYAVEP